MLGRSQIPYETEDEELQELLGNTKLAEHFVALAKDLDVLEPKTPEDIYKRHLENTSKLFQVAGC
jgi:26S proteasome regulatory subunit N1